MPKQRKKGAKQVRLNKAQVAALHERIVKIASKGPVSPAGFAKHFKMPVPTIGHHLHNLVKAKRLKATGRSNSRRYEAV